MLSTKNSTSWPSVAEILGHGQARKRHTGTRSWRLVHLAIDQGSLGAPPPPFSIHAGFDHFVIEVVAFTGTLAHTGKHRIAAVCLGDVVDQFHDQHGLAHAGTAEQADLAALGIWCQQVDNLDAGYQNFSFRRLFHERRCVR